MPQHFEGSRHASMDRRPPPWDESHYCTGRDRFLGPSEMWSSVAGDYGRMESHCLRSRSPRDRHHITTVDQFGTEGQGHLYSHPSVSEAVDVSGSWLASASLVVKKLSTLMQTDPIRSSEKPSEPVGLPSTSTSQPISAPTQTPVSKEIQTEKNPSPDSSLESEDDAPSPDLGKIFKYVPISPSEDVKMYADLIRKVASSLGLSLCDPHPQVSDTVFDVIHRDVSPIISLRLSSVLLQSIQATWVHPASAPTSTKRLDQMY